MACFLPACLRLSTFAPSTSSCDWRLDDAVGLFFAAGDGSAPQVQAHDGSQGAAPVPAGGISEADQAAIAAAMQVRAKRAEHCASVAAFGA